MIKRYDQPETFFYCDPSCHDHPDYKHNLVLEDYIEMPKILFSIQGKFILSINDTPDMQSVFNAFKIQPVSLLYSVGIKQTKAKELIIQNY